MNGNNHPQETMVEATVPSSSARTGLILGPLHAKLVTAEAEIHRIEGELKAAREAAASLSARQKEVDGALREARVEEAMGRQPKRSIADVKADLAALAEDLETAEARVIGLDRLKAEAAQWLVMVKMELEDRKLAWLTRRATEVRETMEEAARALAEAQRKVIALARVMANHPGLKNKLAELLPSHLIWAELSDGHGPSKYWPQMGDRKVSNELLAEEMSGINEAIEGL